MNKITTLAAISMFAVIMGMSALAPAMAVPKGNSGNAGTEVCHYFAEYLDEEETQLDLANSAWGVLYVSSQGAANGHTNHGDATITSEAEAGFCVSNNDGTITDPTPV